MKPGNNDKEDIKSCMAGYISGSLSLLDDSIVSDCTVHDVRLNMKRQRAALRLLRSQINEKTFAREFLAAKQAGQLLRSWRESAVFRATIVKLENDNKKLFRKLRKNERFQNLMGKMPARNRLLPGQKKIVGEVRSELRRSLGRLRFINPGNTDINYLLPSLERSYAVAAEAYVRSRRKSAPKMIHAFRKRSKDLLYQLDFFRNLNRSRITKIRKELEYMTGKLGKYFDLYQLKKSLGYNGRASAGDPEMNELIIIIRGKQDKYLRKVWPVAYRLFSPGCSLRKLLSLKWYKSV